ncbi:hypothetical protein CDAR_565751 [Caerostris darwini]|uniref:Uncharacterized protein n=1 Tax=Caerostris darwini TaxID=1538125 RepID=A0AAV4UYH1_9ARAC|nr:hypothetical protein CDAR_565751 [Caerostris darwini]
MFNISKNKRFQRFRERCLTYERKAVEGGEILSDWSPRGKGWGGCNPTLFSVSSFIPGCHDDGGREEEEDGSADSKVTSRLQRRLTALFGVTFVDHSVVERPDSY